LAVVRRALNDHDRYARQISRTHPAAGRKLAPATRSSIEPQSTTAIHSSPGLVAAAAPLQREMRARFGMGDKEPA
jgi:hypothetical protein